eukprot:TRINITY_DN10118_c0_g3_i2.p1 TRINITY_DN10118_c0_g3~~TRINITY_DN10118_c0_g3_i2.p1  ORF type:complete len:778 (+),score=114.37 TRINITY_DN10118_c0_g3_i2:48-2336(+)
MCIRDSLLILVMIKEKIRTEVDLKLFSQQAQITQVLPTVSISQYIYQIVHNNATYILKGYIIPLAPFDPSNPKSVQSFKAAISHISDIFQDYSTAKAAGFFSPHILKPLLMDYAVEVQDDECCMYVEIIEEYGGVELDKIKPVSVKLGYDLMRQAAKALALVHSMEKMCVGVKPEKMVYSEEKRLLKLDISSIQAKLADKATTSEEASGLKYTPPEVPQMQNSLSIGSNSNLASNSADVYSWAISFYLLLINNADLDSKAKKYQLEEKNYKYFLEEVRVNFHSVHIKSKKEQYMIRFMRKVLISALEYNPKERPATKEILGKMKEFEKENMMKYSKAELEYNENFVELLALGQGTKYVLTEATEEKKVELSCKHKVTKDNLKGYAIAQFINKQPYYHYGYCNACGKEQAVTSIPLDCGCVWRKIGKRIGFISELHDASNKRYCNYRALSLIDIYLVNDYAPLSFFLLSFPDCEQKNHNTMYYLVKGIQKQGVKSIAWTLKNTKLITYLDFTYENMTNKKFNIITESLCNNGSVKRLSLKCNTTKAENVETLCTTLRINKSIIYLSLAGSFLGNLQLKMIGEALKVNKVLVMLDLYKCVIKDNGVKEIAKALEVNKTIEYLFLSNNHFRSEGLQAIIKMLKSNKTLKNLALNANVISNESIADISKALTVNRTLTHLHMCENSITVEGAKSIGKMLRVNKALVLLDLSKNMIDDAGAKEIYKALDYAIALRQLYLINTSISEHLGTKLKAAAKKHPKLKIYFE